MNAPSRRPLRNSDALTLESKSVGDTFAFYCEKARRRIDGISVVAVKCFG